MSLEVLFGIGVVAIIVIGFLGRLIPKRMPPSKSFKCGRCGTQATHNDRTAEAWRNGKTKFFCQSCHHKWLQSQPPRPSYPSSGRGGYTTRASPGRGSGCLVVLVLFALVPVGVWVVWAYA